MRSDAPNPQPRADTPTTDMPDVGRRIRGLREERGLSLSELARRAGIGKATLSGLENGTRNPTLETLWAVTAQLGVPLAAAVGTGPVAHGAAVQGVLLEVFEEEGATYELYRLVVPAARRRPRPPTRRASPSTSPSSPGRCAPDRPTRPCSPAASTSPGAPTSRTPTPPGTRTSTRAS
ncbi:helix-turn-helix domain-containing protein [Planomonospora algeriensis]